MARIVIEVRFETNAGEVLAKEAGQLPADEPIGSSISQWLFEKIISVRLSGLGLNKEHEK